MTLTLTINNVDRLDNGMPAEFVLNRRGAMIGRSPTCDWSLPDAKHYISSRHCEVTFRDGFYTLTDVSTNGTLLNGAADRMTDPRRIEPGDRFQVGQYELVAQLTGEAAAAIERDEEAQVQAAQAGEWGGWDRHGGGGEPAPDPLAVPADGSWSAAPAADDGWGAAPASAPPASSDWGAAPAAPAGGGNDWGAAPPAAPADSGWGAAPAAAGSPAQSWAPQAGPGLARDAAHIAAARGAAPSPTGAASLGGGFTPAPRAAEPPVRSAWEQAQPQQQGASAWSSAAPDRPAAPTADDVWGKIAEGNVVDWARGGFGQPVEAKRDPLGLDKPAASEALPKPQPRMAQFDAAGANAGDWGAAAPAASGEAGWGSEPAAAKPAAPPANAEWDAAPAPAASPSAPPRAAAPPPAAAPAPPAAPKGGDVGPLIDAFAAAAGLKPGQLKVQGVEALERAGALVRQLVAGLVVMVEARARAKSQMGAEATSLSFEGNNPIKFARAPEQAVAQLLNPKERGFMEAGQAVEDAYYDLQSHQMATLKAMQGALRATLDRFSPTSIRSRADAKGLMAKIMPGAKEAALWQAYEREFSGVAQGSDEAFMDVFAKEFRKAYMESASQRGR